MEQFISNIPPLNGCDVLGNLEKRQSARICATSSGMELVDAQVATGSLAAVAA